MPGRNRRLRLLTVGALLFFALLVYTRNSSRRVEKYQDYFGDKLVLSGPGGVGGGSVLRPSLGDIPPQQERYPLPRPEQPEEEGEVTIVWVDPPEWAEEEEAAKAAEQLKQSQSQEGQDQGQDQDRGKESTQESWQDGGDGGPDLRGEPVEEQVPLEPVPVKQNFVVPSNDGPTKTDQSGNSAAAGDEDLPPAYEEEGDPTGKGRVEIKEDPNQSTHLPVLHWSKVPEQFPIKTTIALPTGSSKSFPKIQRAEKELARNGVDAERLAAVKTAAQHSWDGYRKAAFGADEVKPNSGRSNNPFNGWGATLVDALDTLWIMGMKKEYAEAVQKVGEIDFTTSKRSDIPLFETTIRYLGGLLGAYDVSGRDAKYRVLLDKAIELGDVLYAAFDTPNRMPQTYYRWAPTFASATHRASSRVVMAELGSLSMEFTRLAQITGDDKFYDAIARVTDALESYQNSTRLPGMWPTYLDASGCGRPTTTTTTTTNRRGQSEPMDVPDGSGWQMVAGEAVFTGQETLAPEVNAEQGATEDSSADGERGLKLDEAALISDLGSAKRRRAVDDVNNSCLPQGLVSVGHSATETYTLSGMSDSTYEYLPKTHLLLGGLAEQYKDMYLFSAESAIQNLIYKPMTPDERDILMSGELKVLYNSTAAHEGDTDHLYYTTFNPEVAHLACFAGGMFAMGGVVFNRPEHVAIGAKLTAGCVWAYNATASGIMPEGGSLMACPDPWAPCPWNETAYWNELDPYAGNRALNEPATKDAVAKAITDIAEKMAAAADEAKKASTSAEVVSSKSAKEDHPLRKLADLDSPPELAAGVRKKVESMAKAQAKVEAAVGGDQADPRASYGEGESEGSGALRKRELADDTTHTRPGSHSKLAAEPLRPRTPPGRTAYSDDETQAEFLARKIATDRLPAGFTKIGGRSYILRPEAIESVFYMYRITGDAHWRDVGWDMWTAIATHTHAAHGASAIDDITSDAPRQTDSEESFWLAETLKYFYLLYDDPARWSLDDWVLNTEAHFLRRPPYEFAEG